MVSHPELESTPNRVATASTQVEAEVDRLRRQVATLEQENGALWADLKACQKSPSSQAQVAELEKAYAVLQTEVREHYRCEQVLQGEAIIARERERTDRERAAELEQANTQLQQTLADLSQSVARYRQCFENSPISTVFIAPDGHPVEANQAFERKYGWTVEQLHEVGFNIFTDPQLAANGTLPYLQRALAGGTVIEPPPIFTIPAESLREHNTRQDKAIISRSGMPQARCRKLWKCLRLSPIC